MTPEERTCLEIVRWLRRTVITGWTDEQIVNAFIRQRAPHSKLKARKLTNDQVFRVRVKYHHFGKSVASLAREHHVSEPTMRRILTGRTYREANGPTGPLASRSQHIRHNNLGG